MNQKFLLVSTVFLIGRESNLVGLGRHGGEQSLVDDRSSYGLPKSHHATKQEAQLKKAEQSAWLLTL
jgi:hypothetical protein